MIVATGSKVSLRHAEPADRERLAEYAVEKRARLVQEASHSYIRRRALVDAVPEALLRKRMAEVAESVDAWRSQLAA